VLPLPELISELLVTDPPPMTGGSVTRVPPWPSEVALKFPEVNEPTRVRVVECRKGLGLAQDGTDLGPGGIIVA
jgi:hypothetical protein